jgi:hypothetical protein
MATEQWRRELRTFRPRPRSPAPPSPVHPDEPPKFRHSIPAFSVLSTHARARTEPKRLRIQQVPSTGSSHLQRDVRRWVPQQVPHHTSFVTCHRDRFVSCRSGHLYESAGTVAISTPGHCFTHVPSIRDAW